MRGKTILYINLLGLVLCAAHSTGQGQEPKKEEWQAYEDSTLRFEYPKSWKAKRSDELHERVWTVKAPDGGFWRLGDVSIDEYIIPREKRPLNTIAAESEWGSHKFIDKPKPFQLKGADCLRYATEGKALDAVCGDEENRPLPCLETIIAVDCYDKRKRFFSISSHLSRYLERGKLDDRAKRNQKVFDHLVQSLEFKQVAESTSTRREK